jgi:hypothetical protein
LPGSAPQTTRAYAYFPKTVGVVVRDDAGAPIAGAEVMFSFEATGPDDPFLMFLDEGGGIITTDAQGIATVPVAAGHVPGLVGLVAYSGEAASRVMPLTIRGAPPVEMKMVWGNGQTAAPMQPFPWPWVVRAIDAHGRPVPYAVVVFNGQWDDGQPGALFEGKDMFAVMADEYGFAVSPRPRANEIQGSGMGDSCGFDMSCTPFNFTIGVR